MVTFYGLKLGRDTYFLIFSLITTSQDIGDVRTLFKMYGDDAAPIVFPSF